jgi:hypothetical protein
MIVGMIIINGIKLTIAEVARGGGGWARADKK